MEMFKKSYSSKIYTCSKNSVLMLFALFMRIVRNWLSMLYSIAILLEWFSLDHILVYYFMIYQGMVLRFFLCFNNHLSKAWNVTLLWAIWRDRNKWMLNGTSINPERIILYAKKLMADPKEPSEWCFHNIIARGPCFRMMDSKDMLFVYLDAALNLSNIQRKVCV